MMRLRTSRAVLALLAPVLACAGSGEDLWYQYAYEFAYIEVCILMVMLPIAVVFDQLWHSISHWVDNNAFVYGAKKKVEDDEDSHGHDFHGEHKQLLSIFVNRIGTEFMTLGFLGLLVFLAEFNNLFEALNKAIPNECEEGESHRRLLEGRALGGAVEDCFSLPKTGLDWFHMAEIVHFSLFGGMCLYFLLMAGFVRGSINKMQTWESIRQVDIEQSETLERSGEAEQMPSMFGTLADEYQYRCMQGKLVDALVLWTQCDKDFQEKLLERCGIGIGDPGTYKRLQTELRGSSFDFSAYLALQLEDAVSDSIEINSYSWIVVLVYLIVSFPLHRYAYKTVAEVVMMVMLAPTVAWFAGGLYLFRGQQKAIARRRFHRVTMTPRTTDDLEALEAAEPEITSDPCRCLHGRRLLRAAQVVGFVCSYVLARLIFDPPDWHEHLMLALTATLIILFLWVVMLLWLVNHAPVFIALLSLPPYFNTLNQKAMKNFWKAFKPEHALNVKPLDKRIEESREGTQSLNAHYQHQSTIRQVAVCEQSINIVSPDEMTHASRQRIGLSATPADVATPTNDATQLHL